MLQFRHDCPSPPLSIAWHRTATHLPPHPGWCHCGYRRACHNIALQKLTGYLAQRGEGGRIYCLQRPLPLPLFLPCQGGLPPPLQGGLQLLVVSVHCHLFQGLGYKGGRGRYPCTACSTHKVRSQNFELNKSSTGIEMQCASLQLKLRKKRRY